ncbi:MAG TPA: hypothetical protein VFM09_05040 [Marmoricola sp.]|nr:hypothetical protein [Marmoricola sp.]
MAGVRPCKPQQLHLEAFQDGAGGQFVLSVLISSRSTCRLAGFGQLAFNIGGKQVTVPQQHSTGTAVYRGPVLVNRKPSARATFYWPTLTCGRASRPGQVLLSLPGDTQTIPAAGTVKATPVCDNGTKAQVTAMSFEPTHRPPAPHRESAWAGTKVRLHVPARTSSGAPLAYTVALAPRHTIDLRPCPDFTMALSGAGTRPVEHRYGLNCRGVNREHPRWHGAIPAGQTVRFTMREVVPPTADGPQKVFWKLEVPDDVAAAALTKATP